MTGWEPESPVPRVLGEVGSGRSPTLIVVSGMHGNEPAGVEASRRVLAKLDGRAAALRGRLIFLAGNRSALAHGVRYVERDLNRAWTPERLERLPAAAADRRPGVEDREQLELLGALDSAISGSDGPIFALDLHTTSAADGVFTSIADTLENRALARLIPVPLVLGLEELLRGTLHHHLGERGVVTTVFESGQHLEPLAVDRSEAAIWILVAGTGLLPESWIPELRPARRFLARDGRRQPPVFELRHRHVITPGSGFRMRPGFANFMPVSRGDPVGDDVAGPVVAPESGRLFMPLYQELGGEGFFLIREFQGFWLHPPRWLRAARLDRVVHRFPGLRRDPVRAPALIVDRRVRGGPGGHLLRLLGFRPYRRESHAGVFRHLSGR